MGTQIQNTKETPVQRFISEFRGGYRYFGYWGYGIGGQNQVWSKEDVVDLVERYNGIANCGLSISTFYDGVPYRLFLPLDFDGNLSDTIEDAVKCYNFLCSMDIDMFMSFTGGRGFHIIVSLKPYHYSSLQIQKFIRFIKRILSLKTLDEKLIDYRRLIRIPGTFHIGKSKHNKILYRGCLSDVVAMHSGRRLDIREIINNEPDAYFIEQNGRQVPSIPLHDYPCVEEHLENEPEPHHIIRYSYVAWLYANGMSPEAIFNHLKRRFSNKWVDWNDNMTAIQVNHICRKKNYKPLSCESLKSLGYCIGKQCPYFIDYDNIKSIREYRKNG